MTLTDCAHASRTRWAFACSIASIVLVATLASGCTSAAGTHAVSSASGANSASAAWASPRKALDAKDDAAVYATTGGALKAALGPSASGAAAKVAAMLPTNAGGLIVKQISPDRSWMFDAFDSGSHVQFDRTDGG